MLRLAVLVLLVKLAEEKVIEVTRAQPSLANAPTLSLGQNAYSINESLDGLCNSRIRDPSPQTITFPAVHGNGWGLSRWSGRHCTPTILIGHLRITFTPVFERITRPNIRIEMIVQPFMVQTEQENNPV
jgi:hypothetical protein